MTIHLKDIQEFNSLLIKNGYNKSSFARKVKVSKSLITNITKGTRHPSPALAKKIVETLNVDFDEIFQIKFQSQD